MKKSAALVILCAAFALLAVIAVHAHAGPMVTVPAHGVVAPAPIATLTIDPPPNVTTVVVTDPSVPVVHSPTELAQNSVDTAWDLVEQYGPIWGGMLVVFGALAAFVRRNEKEHWLKQGRMLALLVAGMGVLSAVLEAGLNHGSWAGVLVTAMAAIKLVLSPTTPQPTTAPA